MKVDIDGFKNEDAKEIVALIHRAMFETNITDYSKEDLECQQFIRHFSCVNF